MCGVPNQLIATQQSAGGLNRQVVLTQMHTIRVDSEGNVGAIVNNEGRPCPAHRLANPLSGDVKFAGGRLFIPKLNQADTRRQKSLRNLGAVPATALSRVNNGIEARKNDGIG